MTRILVTGGFGFLGARIKNHLANAGYDTVVGSRLYEAPPKHIHSQKIVKLDWSSITNLEFALNDIDIVIHCAGANNEACDLNSGYEIKNAKVQASNLLAASLRANVGKLITISSTKVYAPSVGMKKETTDIFNNTPYALTKLAMEEEFRKNNNPSLKTVICRVASSYGVPISTGPHTTQGLINKFCIEALSACEINLKNPNLTRDFIPVENVCLAIEQLTTLTFTNRTSEIINICSSQAISLVDMALLIQKRCKELFNHEPKIIVGKSKLEPGPIYSNETAISLGINHEINHKKEIDKILKHYYRILK